MIIVQVIVLCFNGCKKDTLHSKPPSKHQTHSNVALLCYSHSSPDSSLFLHNYFKTLFLQTDNLTSIHRGKVKLNTCYIFGEFAFLLQAKGFCYGTYLIHSVSTKVCLLGLYVFCGKFRYEQPELNTTVAPKGVITKPPKKGENTGCC